MKRELRFVLVFSIIGLLVTILSFFIFISVRTCLSFLFQYNNIFLLFLVINVLIWFFYIVNYKYYKNYYKTILLKFDNVISYKIEKNEIYFLHEFLIDILNIIYKRSYLHIFVLILSLTFAYVVKIYYFFLLFFIMFYLHLLYFIVFLISNLLLRVTFEIKVETAKYNNFDLSFPTLLFLFFYKIPQVLAFLCVYGVYKKNIKSQSALLAFKKTIYYRFWGVPFFCIKIFYEFVEILLKIINSINWRKKNKNKWAAIFIYEFRKSFSFLINEKISILLSEVEFMRIRNNGINNKYRDILGKYFYSLYVNRETGLWDLYKANTPRIHHISTFKPNLKEANTFSIAATHSHSKQIFIKKPFAFEEKYNPYREYPTKESKLQYTFHSGIPTELIKENGRKQLFYKNNNVLNKIQVEMFNHHKKNQFMADFLNEDETRIMIQDESQKYQILKSEFKNLNLDKNTSKLVEVDIPQMEKDLIQIIEREITDEDLRIQMKKSVLKSIKFVDQSQIKNYIIYGASLSNDADTATYLLNEWDKIE